MFVRWKRRRLKKKIGRKGNEDAGYTRSAVLVKSHRVNGEPRQKFVAHLGYVKERLIDQPHIQSWFWRGITSKLDQLDLDLDQRVAIEQAIERVVPRDGDDGTASKALRELEQTIERALPR